MIDTNLSSPTSVLGLYSIAGCLAACCCGCLWRWCSTPPCHVPVALPTQDGLPRPDAGPARRLLPALHLGIRGAAAARATARARTNDQRCRDRRGCGGRRRAGGPQEGGDPLRRRRRRCSRRWHRPFPAELGLLPRARDAPMSLPASLCPPRPPDPRSQSSEPHTSPDHAAGQQTQGILGFIQQVSHSKKQKLVTHIVAYTLIYLY